MNWISNLIDLYDKNELEVGKLIPKEYGSGKQKKISYYTLLPISHTTALAQIEVSIDSNGNFLYARELDKSDGFTIIPCTTLSSARTSKAYPHPLCDNLKYVAGDYTQYMESGEKNVGQNFEDYISALLDWSESEYSHSKVKAIYQYLSKRSLLHDLITYQIIRVSENNMPTEYKIQGIPQMDSFVRFCVVSTKESDSCEMSITTENHSRPEVWLDSSLIKKFIEYYDSMNENTGLCYLTGNRTFLADLHPKKIRNEGDGAKLISGNDSTYFTYRGRFNEKNEAMGVSYEVSQKVHNALKWIIRKQGYTNDGVCIVTWASDMVMPINTYDNTVQLLDKLSDNVSEERDSENIAHRREMDLLEEDYFESDEDEQYDTKEMNALSLVNAIRGYRLRLKNQSNMVIMALDAATPGRLAITYYKELNRSRYLENIEYWQTTCSWLHTSVKDEKPFTYEGMTSLRDIAYALYGIDQEGKLVLHSNSDGKSAMLISTFQRLIPCIIDRKPIPRDMVRVAIRRASMPLAYSNTNWRRILAIACSLVKKERYDYINKEEEWSMNSDMKDVYDRSFLYGRLLAIADRIEYTTYEKDEKEGKRSTNAKRYMNMFSQKPYSTWQYIEERIQPYLEKHKYKAHYEKKLNDVMSMFDIGDFSNNNKLEGLYLLGFHKQSNAFYNNKREDKNDNLNESIIKED